MRDIDALDVYLHGAYAGALERLSQARLRFTYDDAWVGEERSPLSLSLPVRAEPYRHDECAPFFEGLLPEGDFLKAIARTLHVSATNPFQLLTELGGECAGAISVAPSGGPEPGRDPRPPRWLSEVELGALLADLPRRPLIAAIDEEEDGGGFRLSLAGAQDKIGVLAEGDRVGLSYGKPPTTGILKAPIPHVSESVANEAFCMSLAGHVDLDVAAVHPRIAAGQEYLLVHRYDRGPELPDGRIHQEDFCQALGLVPAVKYEGEGGPTVADCADLIRRHCSAPVRDITAFLDALLLNFAIANHDGHAKNYSLLLDGPGSIRLAPLYDLISTAVYPDTDRKLAMRYGGESRPPYLRGRHLDRLAHDLGVKPALVRRRAVVLRERVNEAIDAARRSLPTEFQDRPMLDEVIAVIGARAEAIATRAGEAGRPRRGHSAEVEGSGESFPDGDGIAAGLARFGKELDLATDLMKGAGEQVRALRESGESAEVVALGEALAGKLAKPAQRMKQYGREIFDATVDLDAGVDTILDRIDDRGGLNSTETEFLKTLLEFEDVAERASESSQALYSAIAEMEQISPAFRPAVRQMRAGARDILDAQAILAQLGRRAAAAAPHLG